MDAEHELVRALLSRDYGIVPVSLVDGPRGFVADTYVVDGADGDRYFVKWLPDWASAPAMLRGLAVAEQLRALGVDAVVAPVRTRAGQLATQLDGRTLAVFPFIEGERGAVSDRRLAPTSFNYDFERFVGLLAKVHLTTARLTMPLPYEDFSLPWAEQFTRLLARALEGTGGTAAQLRLRALMHRHGEQMEADWSELLGLARACRAATWTPFLTHGDLLGDNVIIGRDGSLHLIDWDDPLLAPAERDTWFYLNDAEGAAAFLELYRRAGPAYHVWREAQRFYLNWRFFSDLMGYLGPILDDPSPNRQAWHLSELEKTCFEWLWPAMRRGNGAFS